MNRKQRTVAVAVAVIIGLSSVCRADVEAIASFKVFYRNDASADFSVTGSAFYEGPTYNRFFPGGVGNYGHSDANWTSGSTAVGDAGFAVFLPSAVDAQHINYFLYIDPPDNGGTFSQVTATIFARDGYGRSVQLKLPISLNPIDSHGTLAARLYAVSRPSDGSSSLDPAVTRDFLSQDLRSAILDFQARVEELRAEHPEAVDDFAWGSMEQILESCIQIVNKALVESKLGGIAVLASEPVGLAFALTELADVLLEVFLSPPLRTNAKEALARFENTVSIADTLAQKTLLPETISITALVNSPNLLALGGSGQRYHNEFLLFGELTTGTSTFLDFFNRLLATAEITTHNYHDANGDLLSGDSVLVLTSGTKFSRYGFSTGSPSREDFGTDGFASTFNAAFQFFPFSQSGSAAVNADTSFEHGLNGYQTSGNVSLSTGVDGGKTVTLTESSPSSLATTATVPPNESLLIFDYRWVGNYNASENAAFSVDFTTDGVTTLLFQVLANNLASHHTFLRRIITFIPDGLRGKRGAIRFKLNPSSSDGIRSSVVLGGFDILPNRSISKPSTLPIADAGPDRTVFVGSNGLARIASEGGGSFDPNGRPLTYRWTWNGGTATGVRPQITLPAGQTIISLIVNNGAVNSASDSVNIAVQDQKPPEILSLRATPNLLWPPNHQMVPIRLDISTTAASGSTRSRIISVTSNEPVNGSGDGDRDPDWEIVGDLALNLRAERAAKGNGRAYTITIECTNSAGQFATKTVTVMSPRDQSNK